MVGVRIRVLPTPALGAAEIEAIRAVLWRAFGDAPEEAFTEDDWAHALGGVHVVADDDGRVVAHAAVVERELHVAGRPLRTGYVEAVAVDPDRQRRGLGTRLMEAVGRIVRDGFELGALGTGEHGFYERLGWETWRGPTSIRLPDGGEQRTPDEDGYVLVLRTPTTPHDLDLSAPISCDWRPGDVW
ncbi:MAG TPA: GNAT family N-acetyltransferase [Candidatus Limnocylindrales bacterium]|nr:GNAT family N-acetyltransferase [Candidatus Limnocylindrales bacterium]